MKQYGKNWWISSKNVSDWICPFCGGKPDNVLNGKHNLRKDGKHLQVIYIECNHNEKLGKYKEKYSDWKFPTKFKVEELVRFPREIGELKDIN
jgi:hypothetical protein